MLLLSVIERSLLNGICTSMGGLAIVDRLTGITGHSPLAPGCTSYWPHARSASQEPGLVGTPR